MPSGDGVSCVGAGTAPDKAPKCSEQIILINFGHFWASHLELTWPSFHAARGLQARQGGSLVAGASPHELKCFWGRVVPTRTASDHGTSRTLAVREVVPSLSYDSDFQVGGSKMKR